METDNNRKREREMESVQDLPQAKLSKADDSDGFSDDSFEFQINLASQKSQYNLSTEPFKNAKAKVIEAFESSVIAVELDEKNEPKDVFHEIERKPEWVIKEGDYIHAPPEFGSTPIYHSDTLVSCTSVATSTTCVRQGFLRPTVCIKIKFTIHFCVRRQFLQI